MPVPAVIDGIPRGNVTMYPGAERMEVDSAELLGLLEELVQPRLLRDLRATQVPRANERPVLLLHELERQGLAARFDEQKLELHLGIPPAMRRTHTIDFGPQVVIAGTPAQPAVFSAFVNTYVNQDYALQDTVFGSKQGRQPLSAAFDTALNYRSWVLEGSATFQEHLELSPWQRGDVRLVKDDPNSLLRFTAGDLNYRTAGFQQFLPMGGFSLSRNFELQPFLLTVPTSRNEFFLRSPSTLNVYINNRPYQKLALPAGSYDVRNLPLATGLNDVRYEIIDESGKTEEVRLPFNADVDSLQEGLSQFSYNLGFASQPGRNTYRYRSDRFASSLFHRHGFSRLFTGGASFQGDRYVRMAGLEGLLATHMGSFGLELFGSSMQPTTNGFAGRFRYLYKDFLGSRGSQRSVLFQIESRSRRFASLGNTVLPDNVVEHAISSNYSTQVFGSVGVGAGMDYNINRRGGSVTRNSFRTNYNLGKTWRNGWNTNLVASLGKDSAGRTESSVFFFLSYQLPESGHSLSYSLNTPSKTNRVDWRYIAPKARSYNLDVGLENNESQKQMESQIDYLGTRGQITLSHQAINTRAGDRRQLAKLRLASALAFADDSFGLSRPVSDSFAIIARPAGWDGERIDINPDSDGGYDAQVDRLGPAVLPSLTSYSAPRIRVDGSHLTQGLSLGPENYQMFPTYKSGTLIRVGSDATVAAYGVVLGDDGKPLTLTLAYVHSLDEPERPPVEIFTDRQGRFQVEGLKPGRFEIRGLVAPYPFVIPPGTKGMYDIGTLGK